MTTRRCANSGRKSDEDDHRQSAASGSKVEGMSNDGIPGAEGVPGIAAVQGVRFQLIVLQTMPLIRQPCVCIVFRSTVMSIE